MICVEIEHRRRSPRNRRDRRMFWRVIISERRLSRSQRPMAWIIDVAEGRKDVLRLWAEQLHGVTNLAFPRT